MQAKREWQFCKKCGRSFKPEDFEIFEGEVWIICENCRERVIKYRNLSWETKEALLRRDRDFDHDIKILFDKDLIPFVDYEDVKYIVPKQKSYKIENPFSMWGWINAWKLHPLCKGFDI
ncbi:hypothetical protein DRN97_03565 [Methanosarcinales archaeon]|nr:MAG: hypothetical protein DRN97_03565 [Methanosarcinales archaeon]